MIPLLPFALGLATGVVAIRLVRSDATKTGLEKAQNSISSATASGLAVIERASAKARQQLEAPTEDAGPAVTARTATSARASVKTAAKPAARKAAKSARPAAGKTARPRKTAAKPASESTTTD